MIYKKQKSQGRKLHYSKKSVDQPAQACLVVVPRKHSHLEGFLS